MSGILLWTGLTLMLAVSMFVKGFDIVKIGAVVMIIGMVWTWFDYINAHRK